METLENELLKGKTCLLDGDIAAHRAACVAEKTEYLICNVVDVLDATGQHDYWRYEPIGHYAAAKDAKEKALLGEDLIWSRKVDRGVDLALEAVAATIQSIKEKTKCGLLLPILSGKGNFRYSVATTVPYKSKRELIGKPKYLRACKEYIEKQYDNTIITGGIEADDELGIQSKEIGDGCFICSIDKDLDQLPGWHFDWVKGRVYRISKKEADFNLYSQILTGDNTDDVPGLSGVGPQTAKAILAGATGSQALFLRTWDEYRTRTNTDADAAHKYFIEQASLIFVLRDRWNCNLTTMPGFIPREELFGKKVQSKTI